MNISEYLQARHSVRHFEDKEVPQIVLDRLLEAALHSPSWSNTQPYRIAVATGSTKNAIRDELTGLFQAANLVNRMPLPLKIYQGFSKGVIPDGPFKPEKVKYDGELFARKRACGMGLYETLGIAREDKKARNEQMQKNFEFFNAPVAMFLFAHKGLGAYSPLDAGIFLQSLMLAAIDEGLGSCAQGALAIWEAPVRKHFKVDKNYGLLCGVSVGYPSEHVVNTFHPAKRALSDLLLVEKTD